MNGYSALMHDDIIYLVTVTRFKENSNITGKNLASVKTPTHSSNEPTLSSIEVKFLSNPTIMTVIIGPMVDYP